jgi:hypothetical protein
MRSSYDLNKQEKIDGTERSIRDLIAAGWEMESAIVNQQKLWNLGKKDMAAIGEKIRSEQKP